MLFLQRGASHAPASRIVIRPAKSWRNPSAACRRNHEMNASTRLRAHNKQSPTKTRLLRKARKDLHRDFS